jgi:SAM-dependent methyltransferase/N-acetylglutamate synthase-like GNAT family acetyltransferase
MTLETQSNMQIRKAVPDDAIAIASLLARSFAEYESSYTAEAFLATISTPDRIRDRIGEGPVWVVLRNNAVVGTLSAVARSTTLYLRGMAVDPTARGDGIGRELLECSEKYAVRNGFERLFLNTTPFLESAKRLYERYGFSRSDEKPDDLFGTPLFTMVKNLPAAIEQTRTDLQIGYDRVAEEYEGQFRDELDKKPFDRKMLDRLIEKTSGPGMICDLGCGPGQVSGYLHRRSVKVCGIDLSDEMVRRARRLNPNILYQQGDMRALNEIEDETYKGIAAFYSIIHVPHQSVTEALCEIKRVLCSGGTLLITFHIGQKTIHLDEWWGKKVSLDFHFFETDEMKGYLAAAGFELEEAIERDPYPEIEVQTQRAYIFARKP